MRSSVGQYGVSYKVNLRRDSDNAMVTWSTADPKAWTIDQYETLAADARLHRVSAQLGDIVVGGPRNDGSKWPDERRVSRVSATTVLPEWSEEEHANLTRMSDESPTGPTGEEANRLIDWFDKSGISYAERKLHARLRASQTPEAEAEADIRKHGIKSKFYGLEKGGLMARLIGMFKGGQFNLFHTAEDVGASERRVRVKAHTRVVDGKVEVVDVHHRIVRMPASHVPMVPLAKAIPGKLPSSGGMPGGAPQPEPEARPPSKRVMFRHPETGEHRPGIVQSGASKGITVMDEEHGTTHKVHHGHYTVHPDEDGPASARPPKAPPPKPGEPDPHDVGLQQGEQKGKDEQGFSKLKSLSTALPQAVETARADLRMGPASKSARIAAAALWMAETGEKPPAKLKDIRIENATIRAPGNIEFVDPVLARFLGRLIDIEDKMGPIADDGDKAGLDYLQAHIGGGGGNDAFPHGNTDDDDTDGKITLDDIKKAHATHKFARAAQAHEHVTDDDDKGHDAQVKKASKAAGVDPAHVDGKVKAGHKAGARYKDGSKYSDYLADIEARDPHKMQAGAPGAPGSGNAERSNPPR